MLGGFTYTERGILDKTHVRLFTRTMFRRLFERYSFHVVRERCTPIPFENVFPGSPAGRAWPDALYALNIPLV